MLRCCTAMLACALSIFPAAIQAAPPQTSAPSRNWSGWSCSASGESFVVHKTLQRASVDPSWVEMGAPVFAVYVSARGTSTQRLARAVFAEAKTGRKLESKGLIWVARLGGAVIGPGFWPTGLSNNSLSMNSIPATHFGRWRRSAEIVPIEIELADPGMPLPSTEPMMTRAQVDARKVIGTYRLQKAGLSEAWAAGEAAMKARAGSAALAAC